MYFANVITANGITRWLSLFIVSSLNSSLIMSDEFLSDINSLSEILSVDLTALYNVTLIDKLLIEFLDKTVSCCLFNTEDFNNTCADQERYPLVWFYVLK